MASSQIKDRMLYERGKRSHSTMIQDSFKISTIHIINNSSMKMIGNNSYMKKIIIPISGCRTHLSSDKHKIMRYNLRKTSRCLMMRGRRERLGERVSRNRITKYFMRTRQRQRNTSLKSQSHKVMVPFAKDSNRNMRLSNRWMISTPCWKRNFIKQSWLTSTWTSQYNPNWLLIIFKSVKKMISSTWSKCF